MIQSFACTETRSIFEGRASRRFSSVRQQLERRLQLLHNAKRVEDLRLPPGNRLEALRGNRAGQFSIRVNDQFRLCFRWPAAGPSDVECVDYH